MNWPQVQLGPALAKVVRGVTFSQSDATSEPVAEGVPVLRAGNIQQKLVIDKDLVWVARSFVSNDQLLQRNDIVVCTSSGSGALVGKSAILETDFKGTWGAFNAVIRCNPDVLTPQYLAYWLSSGAFQSWKERQVQGANIQNIRQSALEAIRLPLPTLPEQQRIVDVLRQAELLRTLKADAARLIAKAKAALFEQHFGVAGTTDKWPMEPFKKFTTSSKYGPRFPDQQYSDSGVHVLRTTDMNDDGTIRWWEAPRLALTEKQIEEHTLKPGTLVISRSGTIGPFALFDGDARRCVAGAYLIEFGLKETIEPEYVRALFATPYLQRMLTNAARSMALPNINAPSILAIRIPVPPLENQRVFARQIRALREQETQLKNSSANFDELTRALTSEAFTGQLTSNWRDQHHAEITAAAQTRDALLRERGAKLAARPPEPALSLPREEAELSHRHWLLSELSDFQRAVLAGFLSYDGHPLLAEVPDEFDRFRESESLCQHLAAFPPPSPDPLRRTLSQLAALGLIAKVSLPRTNPTTREQEFLTTFRPLRPAEQTRATDVAALRRSLGLDAKPSDEDTPA